MEIDALAFGRFEGFLQSFAESLDNLSTLDSESCLESLLSAAHDLDFTDASVDSLRMIGENLLSLTEGR